jgi:hypothetical protein
MLDDGPHFDFDVLAVDAGFPLVKRDLSMSARGLKKLSTGVDTTAAFYASKMRHPPLTIGTDRPIPFAVL